MPSDKKSKKDTKKKVVDSDSEAENSEPEVQEKKAPAKKSAFALMQNSDSESEKSEEEKPKKKVEKKKKKKDSSDSEDDEPKKKKKEEKDEKKDKKDKKEKKEKKDKKPAPIICEVQSVKPVPKKDKLKVCDVVVGPGDTIQVVTSAPNIEKGVCAIVARAGVTTADGTEVKEGKVGGVESVGMFCGPKQMGWDTDILDENLAVILAEDAPIGKPNPSYEEALEAFKAREAKAAAAAKKDEPSGGGKNKKDKKKKGGKKEESDDDLDAVLLEFKGAAPAEEKKEEEAPKEEEKDDSKEDAKTAANKKKKDKKKGGKAGAGDDDDDFEAALAENKVEAPAAPAEPAKAAPVAAADDDDDDKKPDEELDAKALANRKKKEKMKAKRNAAVGGGGMWGDDDAAKPDADAAAEGEATPAPAAESKKGAKAAPKKESAAVRAIREKAEAQRKLEEEKRTFEEAEKARIAEEERIEREQEEKEEAERARKREARQAKIERQKADGSYQTKKDKEMARRAAQLREMFGMTGAEDEEEDTAPKKKPVATKLQKKKGGKKDEEDKAAEEKAEAKEEKPEPKAEKKEAKKEEEAKPEEEDSDDGWEKVAERLEEVDDSDSSSSSSESGDGSGSDSDSDDFLGYRSPIIVIMGHVDTGKTKLLDKIRRTNVQDGEAGGITQQIGATFFPDIALHEQTTKVDEDYDLEMPGLLVIDTPGHEAFANLRTRGSSLCDMAILVIDIMHGLEPQTVESLEMLKKRKCPFVIALNKVDKMYSWDAGNYTCMQKSFHKQEQTVQEEFRTRYNKILLELNERGLNCALYWENDDIKSTVNIIPTSALTGEGVPDLLYMILKLSQELMASKLEIQKELQCSVIEVKSIEGLGTTIDVVLINGELKEGDQIVLTGMYGPIVTTIRALLTPQPMKEMRVKGDYIHHKKISTSMGVKICAPELENAVAGTELLVCGPEDDLEELKAEVDEGFDSILNDFDKAPEGVFVKASTLGSLEALLCFLKDMKIPVFDVGIGDVQKMDVKKAMIMKEKKHPEFAVILAFDVKVAAQATEQAKKDGVEIFTAEIIYHLFDHFTEYMKKVQESKKQETKADAIFPVMMEVAKEHVFRKTNPIIVGVKVVGGQLREGTPICIPDAKNLEIGRVASIEKDKKPVKVARRGEEVCIKIEQANHQQNIAVGRQFEAPCKMFSKISRESIDTLKEHFRDEMKKEDWEVIVGMKELYGIQ